MSNQNDSAEDLDDLERELKQLVGGPIVSQMNGFGSSEHYLARSWLGQIHRYALEQQEDVVLHDDRLIGPDVDQRQLLVAIGNRLDLDIATLLKAGSGEEVWMIYENLAKLE